MKDDLKILKVEYLSNYWSDFPKILNLSLVEQTHIKNTQHEDNLQQSGENGINLTPHPNKSLIPNFKFKALKSKLKPNTKASDLIWSVCHFYLEIELIWNILHASVHNTAV